MLEELIVEEQVFDLYRKAVRRVKGFYKALSVLKVYNKIINYEQKFSTIWDNNLNDFINEVVDDGLILFLKEGFNVPNHIDLIEGFCDNKIDSSFILSVFNTIVKLNTLNLKGSKNTLKFINNKELSKEYKKLLRGSNDKNQVIKYYLSKIKNNPPTIKYILNSDGAIIKTLELIKKEKPLRDLFVYFARTDNAPFIDYLDNKMRDNELLDKLNSEIYELIKEFKMSVSNYYSDNLKILSSYYSIKKKAGISARELSNKEVISDLLINLNSHLNDNNISKLANLIKNTNENSSLRWVNTVKGLMIYLFNLKLEPKQSISVKSVSKLVNEPVKIIYSHCDIPHEGRINLHYKSNNEDLIAQVSYKRKGRDFSIGGFTERFRDYDWKSRIVKPLTDFHNIERNRARFYWS